MVMAAETPTSNTLNNKSKAEEVKKEAKTVVTVIKKEESNSVGSLLSRLWGKLRAVSPKVSSQESRSSTQVVGVRGAETTETALQPYWKDDKEADPAFLQQTNAFRSAQQLADNGAYQEAATAFAKFSADYPDSQLKPNALFGRALSQLSSGDDNGKVGLQQFVSDYPQHPLSADAKQLLGQ
jgi:TolA-binding protein